MDHLTGLELGPAVLEVTASRVADYLEVTADRSDRWRDAAPPGFAAAALFMVAPGLLDELSGHAVVHGEQGFTWHRPLMMGETLAVTGSVNRVRHRGGVNYVSFEFLAVGGDTPVVGGSSLFLVAGESLPIEAAFERPEPPHGHRGDPEPGQRSASRADLVRYAAATRDWNPIHWDHEAAVAAGLPGVVVHGLLQASWALQEAYSGRPGDRPFASARVRFRSPLLPARPVMVEATSGGDQVVVTLNDPEAEYLSARVELADE